MKEDINLLPPSAKHSRLRRLYGARLSSVYWAVVVSCLLVGGVYSGIMYEQRLAMANLDSQINGLAADDKVIGTSVAEANRLLTAIDQQAKENPSWTQRLAEVLKAAPNNVALTAIRLRPSSAEVSAVNTVLVISGSTRSRPAIVDYERKLKALPWVKQLEAPLANLASGPDVTFTFTITRQETASQP